MLILIRNKTNGYLNDILLLVHYVFFNMDSHFLKNFFHNLYFILRIFFKKILHLYTCFMFLVLNFVCVVGIYIYRDKISLMIHIKYSIILCSHLKRMWDCRKKLENINDNTYFVILIDNTGNREYTIIREGVYLTFNFM